LNGQQKASGSGSAAAGLFDAPGWQLFPQRFFSRPVKQIALARIQQSETEHPAIYAGFCFAQMFWHLSIEYDWMMATDARKAIYSFDVCLLATLFDRAACALRFDQVRRGVPPKIARRSAALPLRKVTTKISPVLMLSRRIA
jgi:hypothetical protein